MKALIGIKKGMTRVIKGDNIVPVTILMLPDVFFPTKKQWDLN